MVDIPLSAPPRLDGQVALVTGAAGGIGSEVVRTFLAAGATVVATDISEEHPFDGESNVHYRRYDVTSPEETEAVVGETLAAHGRIDILVACAGAISNLSLADASDGEWETIWRVNVMGVVNPVRRLYPVMVEQGYGKMVALGSIAAKIGGVASGPAYVSAKSAVHGLMKWVAKSGAPARRLRQHHRPRAGRDADVAEVHRSRAAQGARQRAARPLRPAGGHRPVASCSSARRSRTGSPGRRSTSTAAC